MTAPVGPDELLALVHGGGVPDHSALSGRPCLLLACEPGLEPADSEAAAAWLRRLPCPVLGIAAADADGALSRACDLCLEDEQAVAPLIDAVGRNPIASAVLVQVLRATEAMPLEDALDVESLAYATLQAGVEHQAWLAAHRADAPFQPTDEGPAVILDRDGGRVSLELNRPSNRNAMSVEMRDALVEALQMVLVDDSVDELRIAGRGRCFSVGGDLTEFGTVPDPATGHIVRMLSLPGRLLARCRQRLGEAAQAHVHSACIGSGVEFPAFAGRITAAENAHFQLPEVGMGLIPGAGGCIGIARRMGRQRTAWLALSGRRIRATQALEWGLVDEIVDQEVE